MTIAKLNEKLTEKILVLPFLAGAFTVPVLMIKSLGEARLIQFPELNKIFQYSLFETTTNYSLAILFLTVAAYLILEIFTRQKTNYLQYALISATITTNLLLTLSIGEFLGFTPAFIISAVLTILLHTLFTAITSSSFINTSIIGFALTIFYSSLFFFIQSSDYNLLIISILSFLVVAALMIISHFIQIETEKPTTPQS
jgi:inner membrane protein